MSVKETLTQKLAAEDMAVAIDYSTKVACELVKQASGVKELSSGDAEKVANSLYVPVVLAGLAKLSGAKK